MKGYPPEILRKSEISLGDAERGMLYLESNIAIMKTRSQTFRIAIWVILGITISLSSLALTRPLPLVQEATTAPTVLTTTVATPVAEVRSDAGSTDGIMLIAVVIVLIVIIPILLRRRTWSNGKGKNKLSLNK